MHEAKTILFTCSLLFALSVIAAGSLSFFPSLLYGQTPYYFMLKQALFACASFVVLFAFYSLNPQKKTCFYLLAALSWISILLCIALPFLPESLSRSVFGAKRWVRLGPLSLSPVEFLKISCVFLLSISYARQIDHSKKTIKQEFSKLWKYFFLMIICVSYIYITQNDLGQGAVLFSLLCYLALVAGISRRFFLMSMVFVCILGSVFILSNLTRINRLYSWWAGAQNYFLPFFPQSAQDILRISGSELPYQINHSLNALSNGGLFGQGLGLGVFKLGFLSEIHTDFVLAGLGEEFGFIGFALISFLYIKLAANISKIAYRLEDKRDFIFCQGICYLILASFFINSFGIISIIPIKGIAVPFLSYGGSSMLATSIGLGVVLMLSKKIEKA